MPDLLKGYVYGGDKAAEVSAALARTSAWFSLTPLPDDVYEFAVKDEAGDAAAVIFGLAAAVADAFPPHHVAGLLYGPAAELLLAALGMLMEHTDGSRAKQADAMAAALENEDFGEFARVCREINAESRRQPTEVK